MTAFDSDHLKLIIESILFVADDPVDHDGDFALGQPIDGEGRHMRPSDPGWREFRPERHDHQHAKGPNPVHHPTK